MGKLMTQKKIVILGAGLTGLSAAYKLAKSGYPVIIIESQPQVGGLAATINHNGYYFDLGPHVFSTDRQDILNEVKFIMREDLLVLSRDFKFQILDYFIRGPSFVKGIFFNLPLKVSLINIISYLMARTKAIL